MTREQAKQVAETIAQQLGGRRFLAMTGGQWWGYDVTTEGNAQLQVRLPRSHGFTVALMPSDTYSVEYYKVSMTKGKVSLGTRDDVYAEDLREVFTSLTGLYTSLGTMKGAK